MGRQSGRGGKKEGKSYVVVCLLALLGIGTYRTGYYY